MKARIEGRTVGYLDQGDGFPILWVHGFPLNRDLFQPQLAIAGYRHIVPDLPGFGESEPFQNAATMDDYARGLFQLLDHLAVKRCIAAGLSMGGYVVLAMSRMAPERVAALVLIDSRETPDTEEARIKRYETAERASRDGIGFIVDDMFPKMLTSTTRTNDVERGRSLRAIMESSTADGAVSALQAMAGRPDSSDVLQAFQGPLLLVVGKEDTITPPSDAERMKRVAAASGRPLDSTPTELVVIPDAAHLSNFEQPSLFNEKVEEFLRRHYDRIAPV